MSKRDFPNRETKKPKKGSKKAIIPDILSTPSSVEVVRKRHKKEEEE